MTTPVLAPDYASPVAMVFEAGAFTAVRLPIPSVCVCADGSCRRCYLDDDRVFELSQDV